MVELYERELAEDSEMYQSWTMNELKDWSENIVKTIFQLHAIDGDLDLIEHYQTHYQLIQNEIQFRYEQCPSH